MDRATTADREKARAQRLQRLYHITPVQFAKMLRRQNHTCAICYRPPKNMPLNVDHDHRTGRVRGLICFWCNKHLCTPRNTPTMMRRAADYLESDFDGRTI